MKNKPTYEELQQRVLELESLEHKHQLVLEELQKSNTLLEETQKIAKIGSWSWTLENDTVQWSKGLYEITGWDTEKLSPAFSKQSFFYKKDS